VEGAVTPAVAGVPTVFVQCLDAEIAASEWSRQTASVQQGTGARDSDVGHGDTADLVGSYARGGGQGYFFVPDDATPGGSGGGVSTLPPPAPRYGIVHVLASNVHNPRDIASLLRHELTHAVDQLVHGVDLRLSGMLACSELRASMLGECADGWGLPLSRHSCGRRHAIRSMALLYGDATAQASVQMVAPLCLMPDSSATTSQWWQKGRSHALPTLGDRTGFQRIQAVIDREVAADRAAAGAPGGAAPLQ